jgi:phytoene synthase
VNPKYSSLKQKTSFYFPLLLLPPSQRQALEILYRFCWLADEIADAPKPLSTKRRQFQKFRKDCIATLNGSPPNPFLKDFATVLIEFQISHFYVLNLLKGIEADLYTISFQTFKQLYQYALNVAAAPGLMSMSIFGFKDLAHQNYAKNLGVFLQLTNIIRDFKEDLSLHRQYLPMNDFHRFHLDPYKINNSTPQVTAFFHYQLDRAWSYLKKSRQYLSKSNRSQLMTAEAIASVYVRLHQKLRTHCNQIVLGTIHLTLFDKIYSTFQATSQCLLWKLWLREK